MTEQLDCITFEYLPDDLLPAIDSVQCRVATELGTMAFFTLLCWSAAIMAMLTNSQTREPDGGNQGEIPESYLMETSEPSCVDRDGFRRLLGEKWEEDCNTCTCIKTQTGVGAGCTERDCNPGIGRQCRDEENLIREHLESWQQMRPGFKTVKEIADDAQLIHVNDLLLKIQLGSLEDVIVLTLASPMPGQTVPCLFSGKLGQDDDSLVTVVGCKDDEEVIVRIASRKLISEYQTADFIKVQHLCTYSLGLNLKFMLHQRFLDSVIKVKYLLPSCVFRVLQIIASLSDPCVWTDGLTQGV